MHGSRNRSSVFRQKPAFEGFGSTPGQTSPCGSSFQQTRPAFGSNFFGSSSPFGASSQPAFAATSVPAFGSTSSSIFCATSTPAFGASSTPAFGAASTLAFGSTSTPAFGSIFGNTGMLFGASSAPTFGSPGRLLFSFSNTPACGGSSTPAFGSSNTTSFGSPCTSSFGFGSAITFGAQTSTPTFGSPGLGQSTFGSQVAGTRVTPYTATPEPDASDTQPAGMLESISAMPVYKDKSLEELRWEDCQRGDKGTSNKDGVHQVGEELNAINTAEIEVPVHCSADVRANVPMKSAPRNESVSAWKKPGVAALPYPGELGYIASIDGVAQLDAEEVQALVQKFEVAVVGRLLGKMIPFFHLNSGLKRMWDKFGQFKLILLSNDCFVCLFNSMEARDSVLMGGPWIIEGQALGLDRWSPDLSPVSMHGFVMPVWVRLPDLPLYCWGSRSIASIASLLGEPLWIDDATNKMDIGEFARVCVRLDLSKPLKLGVMVQGLQGPFLQSVEYEGLSDFCFRCGLVGHKELSCQTKATSGAKAGTEVREATLRSEAGGTGLGCGPTAIERNHGLKETHAGAMTKNVEASCSEQVKEETAGEAEG